MLPIFYINLKKDKERDKLFINDSIKYKLDINRIEGINGNEYNNNEVLNVENYMNNGFLKVNNKKYFYSISSKVPPKNGELGCCLSHLKTIIHIRDMNIDTGIIMEDDIDFSLIKEWISYIDIKSITTNAPNNWELLKMHTSNDKVQKIIYNKYFAEKKLYIEMEPYSLSNWSTMCYIINKKYINSFFEKYYKNDVFKFDTKYFVADLIFYFKKNMYHYTIPLFKSKNLKTNIWHTYDTNPADDKSNKIIDNFWERKKRIVDEKSNKIIDNFMERQN